MSFYLSKNKFLTLKVTLSAMDTFRNIWDLQSVFIYI